MPSSARLPTLIVTLLALVARLDGVPPQVPSPEGYFGFRMGAEGRLVDWTGMVAYLRAVDRASERVLVREIGRTTGDRPYVVVTIAEPDTLSQLDQARRTQHQLADPRVTPEHVAARLARDGKAVVVVGAGVHSTEIGSMQMMPELVHRLATDKSPATAHLLANLIVLLVPSENPDGLQMVADWHARNAGTPFEEAPLPELYHPFAGHDNNRDAFMQTQVETQHLARLLYRDWLPEVYLDLHQMGSTRARIFVPPYGSPVNPNVDPLVWSEANLLGQTMAAALQASGRTGVMWGETYSGYWQGANSSMPWWHNIVGVLSEVAGARLAAPVVQDAAHPAPGSMAAPPAPEARSGAPTIPPPGDTQHRMTYPAPWLGGTWTPRDVVEYHLHAALGLLEGAANNRVILKGNFYRMHRRTIEHFQAHGPFAYVVPAAQRDPVTAARLVRAVMAGGGEVDRATAPFTAERRRFGAGSYVIRLAQPFGRWVKDMLEPQLYPEPAAGPVQPYDVTAWTLGMLMGVEVVEVRRTFEASLARVRGELPVPAGRLRGEGDIYLLPRDRNGAATAVNAWLAAGASVAWSPDALVLPDGELAPGTFIVRGVSRELVAETARREGVDVIATDLRPARPMMTLPAPRVAVIEPWGGSIDAGWTRWVLEQHGFDYERIRPSEVAVRPLQERFDVLVVPESPPLLLVRGLQGAHVRPEHRGGLGEAGLAALKQFLQQGGTIVTLGNAAQFAIDFLDMPLTVTARADDAAAVYSPGSLLRLEVRPEHPLGYGLPAEVDVLVRYNATYAPARGGEGVTVVGRFPDEHLLRSGYLRGAQHLQGEAIVLDVPMGRGRIVVLGPRVQHRGQTYGTFKLLFNAIYSGASSAPTPASPTEQ